MNGYTPHSDVTSTVVLVTTLPSAAVLPDELLQLPHWLLWKYVYKTGQAKPAKVPYYVDGRPRHGTLDSPEDIGRLRPFNDAVAAALNPAGEWVGVGFAVTADSGVGGIDLDNCLDEHGAFINEPIKAIYESAKANNCYCEISPSGSGVRIIGKTDGFKSFNRGGFEAYCSKRFLTITGNCRDNPKGFGSVDATIDLINKLVPTGQQGASNKSETFVDDLSSGIYVKPVQVPEGGRNDAVLKYAGHLRGLGTPEAAVLEATRDFNAACCKPPLDGEEVEQIVGRYSKSQTSAANIHADDWPDPKPINTALAPVAPFELDLLPDKFKPYVRDVSELMQTPPDFVAVSLMVAAGATLGNAWAIAPKAHDVSWKMPPVLWGGVVGRPGSMKSPAMAKALAPLRPIEQALASQHQQKMQQYDLDKLVYDAQYALAKKALSKNPSAPVSLPLKLDEPQAEHLLVNDATYEKLGEILRWSPRGVLVCMDELVGLLKGLETQGQEKARGFYLTAWNGNQSYNVERIGRGSFTIPRLSLCVLGGIQPEKLKEYTAFATNGGSGDDGLMQRFQLLVWPDVSSVWKNIDRPHDVQAHNDAMSVFQYLRDLDPATVGARDDGMGEPAYLHFAPDAQKQFNSIRSAYEKQGRSGSLEPALEAHFGKYSGMIASLALLTHLIDGGTGPVSLNATNKAINWSLYLCQHAMRVYAAASSSAATSAKVLSEKIVDGKVKVEFTAREIKRRGWRNLSTHEDVSAALDKLEENDWIKPLENTGLGRPSQRYVVNPKITCKRGRS